MTIEVEGPDGSVHEFPDGTKPKAIKTAMARHYSSAPKAKEKTRLSPLDKLLQGAGDIPIGGAQLLLHTIAKAEPDTPRAQARAKKFDEFVKAREQEYEARKAASGDKGFDLLRLGGGLLVPLPGGPAMKGASALGKVAVRGAEGAIQALLQPVASDNYWEEKASQAATGAAMGGTLAAGGNALRLLTERAKGGPKPSLAPKGAPAPEAQPHAAPEAPQAAVKPKVRVKAGSAPSPAQAAADDAVEAAVKAGGKPQNNTLADAQKAWAKSSKDPKHAERAAKLMEDGVELTLGQRAGGMAKRIEEANKSNPYVGQAIRDNEQRALTSFNRVAARKSLEAAGLPADFPPVAEGRDFVKVAHDRFSKAYDANAEKYKLTGDETLRDALQGVHASLRELPADKRLQFESIMDRRVFDRMGIKLSKDEGFADALDQISGKSLNGPTFKEVESELTYLSGKYHSAPDPADNLFAEHLDEALGALRDNMERSSDPSVRAQLKKLNTGYAMFTRVRGAAQNRATAGGRFTTGDFLGAVKRLDRSKAKGAFARGDALFQDFAEDAHAVLANVMADSGTAERTNITRPGMIGAGAGGMVGSMLGGPLGAAAGIGVEAAARPTVNALADKLLQQRTESLMSGEATKAPGNINNYLRAAQMRAGQLAPYTHMLQRPLVRGSTMPYLPAPPDQGPSQ